ncbi:unnamed protein product [Penicillium roqueforti FM164]|uniref:Genomic scaffold, ProqFM164S03 n=1 Tax=Penicillium roqueforti (strain FM164) TaxID=1365484 RepID=W6QEU9_PENRF|nr:unnamed protein product [Penicillium roqueforti FM164]
MSIAALPVDAMVAICDHLELSYYFALRLTCRATYNNTIEISARRCYTSISLLLTSDSLCRLEEIAADDILRTFVQKIWIVPALFEGKEKMTDSRFAHSKFGNGARKGWKGNAAELQARYIAFQAIEEDHRAISKSSALRDTLDRCLPRFENAVVFGLQSDPMERLLNLEKGSYIRCLGLPELRNQLSCTGRPSTWFDGCYLPVMGNAHAFAFSALVETIINSNREVLALHTCRGYYCGMTMRNLQLTESQYKRLLPLLRELECLHMCLRLPRKQEDLDKSGFCFLLDILVAVAPTLKTLVFFQWHPKYELNPRYFEELSRGLHFSQLQDLSLQSIEVTVNTLKAFLQSAAATLRRMTLKSVGLRDPITSAPDLGPMDRESRIRDRNLRLL